MPYMKFLGLFFILYCIPKTCRRCYWLCLGSWKKVTTTETDGRSAAYTLSAHTAGRLSGTLLKNSHGLLDYPFFGCLLNCIALRLIEMKLDQRLKDCNEIVLYILMLFFENFLNLHF